MNYTDEELDALRASSQEQLKQEPRLRSASYRDGQLIFELCGVPAPQGASLGVPARSLREFENASGEQLAAMEITATGNAVHWPLLDVQMSTVALLELLTGVRAAQTTGAQGGQARSTAKSAAARANGAKGVRPRAKVEPVAA